LLIPAVVVPYYLRVRKREKDARARFEKARISGLQAAVSMHPLIDALRCIGCGGCVRACPDGDVLGVIEGKAILVHGAKCVGHGLCAEACPMGAIQLVMAAPGRSADLPVLSEQYETTVSNMFIVGELGGLGLIKNAITQGRQAVEHIAARSPSHNGIYDVAIVGAGPAGLGAALTAKKHGMKYILLEQGDVGGTILQYPRRKIVMTSPVEIPLWGKLKLTETSKESLLDIWQDILRKTRLSINTHEKLNGIQSGGDRFALQSSQGGYEARHVVLALGRRGTPRKLGVPGEALGKVMYRLIDAGSYHDSDVLVVGGGDSAVEAAMGLALQGSNRVTLSYRKPEFTRLKERNARRLGQCRRDGTINVVLDSTVKEILDDAVLLETPEGSRRVPNHYVFVFAGGETPFNFLKSIGIEFQAQVIE
ncbi:MAG: NAD(P)-binding domain-containing protein, partial [Bacteroidota bacterium]